MSHSSRSFLQQSSHSEWRWPLDLESYDPSPDLTPGEQAALARRSRFPSRLGYWTPLFYQELGRLAEPVRDVLDYIHSKGHARTAVQHVITEELLRHREPFGPGTQRSGDRSWAILGMSVCNANTSLATRAMRSWEWPICSTASLISAVLADSSESPWHSGCSSKIVSMPPSIGFSVS